MDGKSIEPGSRDLGFNYHFIYFDPRQVISALWALVSLSLEERQYNLSCKCHMMGVSENYIEECALRSKVMSTNVTLSSYSYIYLLTIIFWLLWIIYLGWKKCGTLLYCYTAYPPLWKFDQVRHILEPMTPTLQCSLYFKETTWKNVFTFELYFQVFLSFKCTEWLVFQCAQNVQAIET